MHSLEILLKVLALSIAMVAVLRSIHLPPILGYLLAGTLASPFAFGWLKGAAELDFIAEFGIVFLLFTVGLELSVPKLISMRRALLGLGGMQMLICIFVSIGIGALVGLPISASIPIAGALALSSTAVATKLLIEQNELQHTHGHISLSILLFQDLAAVPFLILIPALGAGNACQALQSDWIGRTALQFFPILETSEGAAISLVLASSLVKGILLFIVLLLAGRFILRPLLYHIGRSRSSELFMLCALLLVLLSAFITEQMHLSMALGAFLAGVMLAETEYHYQIENDIAPFRDVLLGLFFIKVGLSLQPEILISEWMWVLGIVFGLILSKGVIIAFLARIAGYETHTAIRAGLCLAQGGELGFAFLTLASTHHLLEPRQNQIITASVILSLMIAPFLIRKNESLSRILYKTIFFRQPLPSNKRDLPVMERSLKKHVIICGYGRVGQAIARFLEQAGTPFIGLDLDPKRLEEASTAGEPVVYGDSSHLKALSSVGLEKAKLVIICYENPASAIKTVSLIRGANFTLPVLVRTRDDSYLDSLQKAGATEVIPELLEGSLMLASHALLLLGIAPMKVQHYIEQVKHSRYQMLRASFQGTDDGHTDSIEQQREALHAVRITEGAWAVDKTLEELFEAGLNIKISSFSRDGFKTSRPSPEMIFQPEDILVLQGTPESLYLAEEKLLQG